MACTTWLNCKYCLWTDLYLNRLVHKILFYYYWLVDWPLPAPLGTGGQAVDNVFCELVGDNFLGKIFFFFAFLSAVDQHIPTKIVIDTNSPRSLNWKRSSPSYSQEKKTTTLRIYRLNKPDDKLKLRSGSQHAKYLLRRKQARASIWKKNRNCI